MAVERHERGASVKPRSDILLVPAANAPAKPWERVPELLAAMLLGTSVTDGVSASPDVLRTDHRHQTRRLRFDAPDVAASNFDAVELLRLRNGCRRRVLIPVGCAAANGTAAAKPNPSAQARQALLFFSSSHPEGPLVPAFSAWVPCDARPDMALRLMDP